MRDGEGKEEGGIGDILKSLDISKLMDSIQQVKEQTESSTGSAVASSQNKEEHTENDSEVVQCTCTCSTYTCILYMTRPLCCI